jgi:[ribosomal protein S18]-alanine N-acetyltransferase
MDRTYRFELRPAERARDLTRMVEIERACFPPDLAYLRSELYHFLRAKNATTLIAEERETKRMAGFVIVSWRKGCKVGYVQTIDVDPAEQGNGLGRLLVETAERVMAERGLTTSILQVYLRNNTALMLYLKEGYTIRRVRSKYYLNSYRGARDALEMVKELAPMAPTVLTTTIIPENVVPAPRPAAAAPTVAAELG